MLTIRTGERFIVAAYYNEFDPAMAAGLRELISAGLIAAGDVDCRSIKEVMPDDLKGYTQCHFFAGIGGWSYAARLAGWDDARPLWTGSCPCQPFSVAGKQEGENDARHLWPEFYRIIIQRDPAIVFGEQVAGTDGVMWADGVAKDFEAIGRAFGAAVLSGPLVGAPHQRDRFYFVADAGRPDPARGSANLRRNARSQCLGEAWAYSNWHGGMHQPHLLDDGIPRRVGKKIVGGFGNAIIPELAAEFICAFDAT